MLALLDHVIWKENTLVCSPFKICETPWEIKYSQCCSIPHTSPLHPINDYISPLPSAPTFSCKIHKIACEINSQHATAAALPWAPDFTILMTTDPLTHLCPNPGPQPSIAKFSKLLVKCHCWAFPHMSPSTISLDYKPPPISVPPIFGAPIDQQASDQQTGGKESAIRNNSISITSPPENCDILLWERNDQVSSPSQRVCERTWRKFVSVGYERECLPNNVNLPSACACPMQTEKTGQFFQLFFFKKFWNFKFSLPYLDLAWQMSTN